MEDNLFVSIEEGAITNGHVTVCVLRTIGSRPCQCDWEKIKNLNMILVSSFVILLFVSINHSKHQYCIICLVSCSWLFLIGVMEVLRV